MTKTLKVFWGHLWGDLMIHGHICTGKLCAYFVYTDFFDFSFVDPAYRILIRSISVDNEQYNTKRKSKVFPDAGRLWIYGFLFVK